MEEYGKFKIGSLVYSPEYKNVGKLIKIDTSAFMPKFVVEYQYGLNKDIEKHNYGSLEPVADLKSFVSLLIKELINIEIPNYDPEIAKNHEIMAKKIDNDVSKRYSNRHKANEIPDEHYKEIGIRASIMDYFNFKNLAAWRIILNINKNMKKINLDEQKSLVTELNLKTDEVEKLKLFSIPKTFCLAALNYAQNQEKDMIDKSHQSEEQPKIMKKKKELERT